LRSHPAIPGLPPDPATDGNLEKGKGAASC
jgi:hypothetical protein